MGAVKLDVLNAALREVGETRITSVSDTTEAALVVLGVYDRVLAHCIEAGLWNHAIRDASISSTATPSFGFSYSHAKPADWVRTAGLSAVGTFQPPLENYADQGVVWFSNVNPIFVKYVSNSASWGLDLSRWPESFTRYVELEIAWRIGKRVNQSDAAREILSKDRDRAKSNALAKDAQNEAAPRRMQPGRFVQSRFGSSGRRIDPLIP